MISPDDSARAIGLLDAITGSDDGAHAAELLELIHIVSDPGNAIAREVQVHLYAMTADFRIHFDAYLSKMKEAA